ncbi:MAG: hypothetical protein WA210_19170, partial [Burkholderiaceae bacterium]
MFTRRQMIQVGGAAGAGMLVPWKGFISLARASAQLAQVPLLGKNIPKWMDPMPHFANARVAAGSALAVSMDNRAQHVLPAALGLQQTNVWAYTVG